MPAPLQIPPIRTVDLPTLSSTAISLRCMSVVMIASATCRAFDVDLAIRGAHTRIPRSIFFIGIGIPILPVEQTSTSSAEIRAGKLDCLKQSSLSSADAVSRAIVWASRSPWRPVHALAFPEFTTIARASSLRTCCRLIFTGAAQTWFVVNTPATTAGISETIKARSRFCPFSEPLPVPSFLMSQKTAAHLKPRGAQIEPATCRNGFFKSAQQSRESRASDSCTAQPDRSRL